MCAETASKLELTSPKCGNFNSHSVHFGRAPADHRGGLFDPRVQRDWCTGRPSHRICDRVRVQ